MSSCSYYVRVFRTESSGHMVKHYRLKDVDCPNCALKIAKAVEGLSGVKKAEVLFASQRMTVEFAGEAGAEFDGRVIKAVQTVEPDMQVLSWQEQTGADARQEHKEKMKEIRQAWQTMALASALLLAGVLVGKVSHSGETALLFLAYLLSGYEVMREAWQRLRKGQTLDETLLMTIATLGAWVLGEGVEAVAVMLFYRVGETLQEMAVHRGRSDIRALSTLVSDTVHVVLDQVVDMPTSAVRPGDILEVRSGERIPVDGEILLGQSALDMSVLTGESLPVPCEPGDKVLSGSMNMGALMRIRCDAPASESAVSRILHMTQEEAARKAAPERFLSRLAAVYTPAVVIVSILVFVLPPVFQLGSWSEWGYRALLLLVVSCPCALVLSVPLSYVAGMGAGAKRGLLFKGGTALEALAKVDALAMDKTGTLTKGEFCVTEIRPAQGVTREQLFETALRLEEKAQHPLAKGILNSPEAREWLQKNDLESAWDSYEEIPGRGVKARRNETIYLCGSRSLLEANGILIPPGHLKDAVHAAAGDMYLGSFLMQDKAREEASQVLRALQKLKLSAVSVWTGDSREGTKAVESLPGITEIRAGMLPKDKAEALKALRGTGRQVAFVGDGVNDAPVLAAANVGIAVGGVGSQAAMEAADCVLAAGNLNALPVGIQIARRTARMVRVNVTLALVIKLGVMALDIAGLASMWMAVIADVGVSLLCVLLAGSIRLGLQKI